LVADRPEGRKALVIDNHDIAETCTATMSAATTIRTLPI
jgi:hypothetical protein